VARARPRRLRWPAARLWSRTAERPDAPRGDSHHRRDAVARPNDPHAATAALAPVLDGSAPMAWPSGLTQAFLLAASAGGALGDEGAAERGPGARAGPGRARRRAVVVPAAPGAGPARAPRPRRAAHAALVAETQSLLAGGKSAPPRAGSQPLELLSDSELRVLRYLPTNLSALQIASELYVWHNTVRIHMRNLYAKLGTHPASPRRRARPRPAPAGTLHPALTHPGLAVARLCGFARIASTAPYPHANVLGSCGRFRPCRWPALRTAPGGGGLTSADIPPAPATGTPDHPLR
jgi:DNA-binding CsgD family transcriptional regulator